MRDANQGKEEIKDFSSASHALFVTSNLVIVHSFQDEKGKKNGLISAQREINE